VIYYLNWRCVVFVIASVSVWFCPPLRSSRQHAQRHGTLHCAWGACSNNQTAMPKARAALKLHVTQAKPRRRTGARSSHRSLQMLYPTHPAQCRLQVAPATVPICAPQRAYSHSAFNTQPQGLPLPESECGGGRGSSAPCTSCIARLRPVHALDHLGFGSRVASVGPSQSHGPCTVRAAAAVAAAAVRRSRSVGTDGSAGTFH
jgi:hypothetical protein